MPLSVEYACPDSPVVCGLCVIHTLSHFEKQVKRNRGTNIYGPRGEFLIMIEINNIGEKTMILNIQSFTFLDAIPQ
jgi:hypothetical protein